MKLILFLFLIFAVFFPLKAEAKETAFNFFSVYMDAGTHSHIAPDDYFSDTFIIENNTSCPVKIRVSDVSNVEDSILYSILQAKWDSSDTYCSFDELATGWYEIEPGKTHEMKLNIYFPGNLGNQYQSAALKAKFTFECRTPENKSFSIHTQDSEKHFTIDSIPGTGDSSGKQVLHILGNCITALLIVTAIYCFCGMLHQKQTGNLFFPFGYRPVVILSGSMEEELMTGAIAIVKKTKDVKENDIIFFITKEGTPVIHRYIATAENGKLITKGDANPKEDLEPVSLEQVQGKVLFALRN